MRWASRTTVNLVIDLSAGLMFLLMLLTAGIIWFALPPGTNKSHLLWGLTRHQWGSIHAALGCFFITIILVHIAMHWQWLVSVIRKRYGHTNPTKRQLIASGAISLVLSTVITNLLIAWATSDVRTIDDQSISPHPSPVMPPAGTSNDELRRFSKTVHPILTAHCLPCHGVQQQGDFRIDEADSYFGNDNRPPRVIPGDSKASPLIKIVNGQRPISKFPQRHLLPARAVATISKWIDEGAPWPAETHSASQSAP